MTTLDPLSRPHVLDTTTTDGYQYLTCQGSTRLTLQISNAAVLIGFGTRPPGMTGSGVFPETDEPFLPVVGGIERPPFDIIRVRSYASGKPARVMLRAL